MCTPCLAGEFEDGMSCTTFYNWFMFHTPPPPFNHCTFIYTFVHACVLSWTKGTLMVITVKVIRLGKNTTVSLVMEIQIYITTYTKNSTLELHIIASCISSCFIISIDK